MQQFSLSANIEEGQDKDFNYIVTPNAQDVASGIVNGYNSGIHSFTIIGSYGTGKSCFLLALEKDLQSKGQHNLINPQTLSSCKKYEVLKIVGDYKDLASLMRNKLAIDGTADNVLDELRNRYNQAKKRGSFLIIFIDEFGKVLEHAAKNDPEQELYFMQKLAEFVNVPTRQILLITTLHQNFSAYARKLSSVQKEEWNKVKGRFKELVFIEPVEQLLYLASKQNGSCKDLGENASGLNKLCQLAKDTKFLSDGLSFETTEALYPLEPFSAYAITQAIQRYGQNERSLFSFLNTKGANSLCEYEDGFYGLANCYDYILHNFYSYLKDNNED